MLAVFLLCAMTGCRDNPDAIVRQGYMPENQTVTVGMAFSSYPAFKAVYWDNYTDELGETMVKATAEYRMNLPEIAACPPTREPKLVRAGRVFLEVRFVVDAKAKKFAYVDSRFIAYSPMGYSLPYQAGLTPVSAILAGQPSLDCSMIYAPAP